jgi:DNA-binding transcriptional MerR regulator
LKLFEICGKKWQETGGGNIYDNIYGNIYSIGEISKLVKISPDTLRYYNEIQLLNPDYINPSNNYRFYSEKQVEKLLYIIDLKECGFNLDDIKIILNLNDKTKMRQIFEKKKNDLLNQSEKINLSLEKIKIKLINL